MVENIKFEKLDVQLYASNGTNIEILGKCQIRVRIGPLWVERTFIVTEHITEPMLSIEWLHENNTKWDFHLGSLNVSGWSSPLKTVARKNHCRRVIVVECTNDDTSDTLINHDTGTIISNKNNDNTKAQNDQNGVRKLVQNDQVINQNDASVRPK